jgi:glucosyl-3-phosphoglycerate synthase
MNASARPPLALALQTYPTSALWHTLAKALRSDNSELHLYGLVTIPPRLSLSEGTLAAQTLREGLESFAQSQGGASVRTLVDYRPLGLLLDELQSAPPALLLLEWAGAFAMTGGLSTEDILRASACDVAFISPHTWEEAGDVLLSLRGGPNLTLGLRVAQALAGAGRVNLLHVDDTPSSEKLDRLYQDAFGEIMQVQGDILPNIVTQAKRHKALVMGATLYHAQGAGTGRIVDSVYAEVSTPLILVRAAQPEAVNFHRLNLTTFRREEGISTRVDRWFAENTFHSQAFADLEALLSLKKQQGLTISLGLPALNEAATVGEVIETIQRHLMQEVPLLDEIVLIDSLSTDDTVAIAESKGVPVYKHPEILPESGSYRGKGEALWKSLHVLQGDLIAWIDTDIKNIHPRFVYGILGPLLKNPRIQYVKGFYRRPIQVGEQLQAYGGGRVTELVARPMFNLFYPELSGLVQPLAGEYAGRRSALEQVPFFSGYGVETGLLIDLYERFGLDAIAQTDLEERIHHNQSLIGLSKMSFAILQVFISRLERRLDLHLLEQANRSMKLIAQTPDRFALEIHDISDVERPPILTLPAYQSAHPRPKV